MKTRPWWGNARWLSGAALAGAVALTPVPAGAMDTGEASPPEVVPAALGDPVAAIPRPPDPPAPPIRLEEADVPREDGGPGAASPGPDRESEPVPEPEAAFEVEGPIFEDPRADLSASLPPEESVPPYPVVINAPVEASIGYYTARERERFGLWLERSGRYLAMIHRLFRERGLPPDLAYTAMVESGFSSRAVSRVGAKGLWQFMEGTARRYGLVVNRWVDERLDPVKSTIAAAQYLNDLYGMFGHWFLAQAAYNAGEARVARAVRLARTSDFWALTRTRHLPNETKRFVPQILAATLITREPARYGFEVTLERPMAYDEVTVRRPLDLETVAALAEVPAEVVRDLNPALRGGITPPFGRYVLRVPVGTGPRVEAGLEEGAATLTAWGLHRVQGNQSLADIARMYRISPQRLAEVNQLRGSRLRGVAEVLVPLSNKVPAKSAPPDRGDVRRPARAGPGPAGEGREVVVRRGDTLWGIAARHGIEPQALARVNGRDLDDRLFPGDRLRIVTP